MKLLRILLLSLAINSLRAADQSQYIYPGGVDHPTQHWLFPDLTTLYNTSGFFSQDINKVAFESDTKTYWYLLDTTPTWSWFGGGPFTYTGTTVTASARIETPNWVSATGGFRTGASPTANGLFLQSQGFLSYLDSTWALPATGGTSGQLLTSQGVTGQATWTDTPVVVNASTVTQTGFAADTYLAGSNTPVAAGNWKVKGQYHCVFDMTKTGAGTATPIITVRMGTLGTTSDAAIATLTFGAGTGVADTGIFDIRVTFRTVGSGTSAVIVVLADCRHHLAATGLTSTGASGEGILNTTSAGFNSTTQTQLGLSFNGGISFSGTNTSVQAELKQ